MSTSTDTRMQSISSELDAFLASEFDDPWLVERTLKSSPHEVTEVVRPHGASEGGERFVRKRIECVKGLGTAYEELVRAQTSGVQLPGVPRIVSCERSAGSLTVVMEFIEGDALDRFAVAFGAGDALALLVVPALADAVVCLHERLDAPLIHRDLKPQNVIVRRGSPVIIDFGIARSWREGAETDTAHFLTRAYAPPEQYGFGQTDVRSDVYALGKLLFFCLTGATPPSACDVGACLRAGLSEDCAHVVACACAFDPAARFQTARAFAAAARDALGLAPLAPPPVQPAAVLREHPSASPVTGIFIEPTFPPVSIRPRGFGLICAAVRRVVSRALASVPRWVGRIWNAAVLIVWAFYLMGCILAVVTPNAHDASLPAWFLILEYLGMAAFDFTIIAYLVLDRRRLRRRFPALARLSICNEVKVGIAVIGVSMLVTVAAGAASGAI